MKAGPLLALGMGLLSPLAYAGEITVVDTYVRVGSQANYGKSQLLAIRDGPNHAHLSLKNHAYLRPSLSNIPAGAVGTDVASAKLNLWIDSVLKPGTFDVVQVTAPWSEDTLTGNNEPAFGLTVVSGIPIAQGNAQSFLVIDVTTLVRDWIDGAPNHGLCLMPSNGVYFRIDSKENQKTSHVASLEITMSSAGPAGPPGAAGPQGLLGPVGPAGPI